MRKIAVLTTFLVLTLAVYALAYYDIIFVIDGSTGPVGSPTGSTPADFKLMKDAISATIKNKIERNCGNRVGVVQFSDLIDTYKALKLKFITDANFTATADTVSMIIQKGGSYRNFEAGIGHARGLIRDAPACSPNRTILCLMSCNFANQGETDPCRLRGQALAELLCGSFDSHFDELHTFIINPKSVAGAVFLVRLGTAQPSCDVTLSRLPGNAYEVNSPTQIADLVAGTFPKVTCIVPTLSEWGLIIFSFLLLAYLTWFLYRKIKLSTPLLSEFFYWFFP